jgi:hypothetical protein
MSEPVFNGGCLCGAVRFRAMGAPRYLCYCHCESCRRAAGAASVPWATFGRERFELTGAAVVEFRSSAQVLRGFCGTCGSSLTYRNETRADEVDVVLTALDEPALLAPAAHVWVADKLPWVHIDDDLPQHARGASP